MHPVFEFVPVTVYMVVVVGLIAVIDDVEPVFQLYVFAPVTVAVDAPPIHTKLGVVPVVKIGLGLTNTTCVFPDMQPTELVPLTE